MAERKIFRRPKITKEFATGIVVFVFLFAVVIGSASNGGEITGFAVFDDLADALDNINLPTQAQEAIEEAGPEAPACAGDTCGLGNVPIRVEEGPIKALEVNEERTALFQSSNPTHSSTVGGIGEVTVTASRAIVAGSYIKLFKDNENTQVDRGYTTIDGTIMTTGSLTQEAGAYKAEYKIVTEDGVSEEGQFSFTVG
jgi:methionine-rich copper-binding protein CopC